MTSTHIDMLKEKATRLNYDMTVWFTNNEGKIFGSRMYTQNLQMSLRSNPAFQSAFPKVREFIQNATDYLEITNQLGERMPSITLVSSKPRDTMYKLTVRADGEEILSFAAKDQNCLVIKQCHTFPLSPDVIKLGVVDAAKSKGRSAGGFGFGMKDSIAQIIHDGGNVSYEMASSTHRVTWTFVAAEEKSKSPSIQASNGLAVKIAAKRASVSVSDINTLTITIDQSNIARAFLNEVVPRCAVFWSPAISEDALMLRSDPASKSHLAVCSIGDACKIDGVIVDLVRNTFDEKRDLLPMSGIYCFGIFVQNFPPRERMCHTLIMCGSGSVNVTGRDRNAVHLPNVAAAVASLLVSSSMREGPAGDLARTTIAAQFGVRTDAALAARAAKLFAEDTTTCKTGVYLGIVVDHICPQILASIQFGNRNVKCYLPFANDTQRWAHGRIANMEDGAPVVHELPEDASLYNVRLCKPLDPATITKTYIELASDVCTMNLPICTIAKHVLRSGGIVGIDVAAINVRNDEIDPGFQTWTFNYKLYIAAAEIDSVCDRERFRLLCTGVIAAYTATNVRTGVAKLLEKSTELGDVVDEGDLSSLVDKLASGDDGDVDNGITEEEGEEEETGTADAADVEAPAPPQHDIAGDQSASSNTEVSEQLNDDDSDTEVDDATAILVTMLEAASRKTPHAVEAAIRIVRQRV